jgi:hypothetical protein
MSYPKINVKDAVVVITGAGRGIGLESARQFAAKGATVALGDLEGDLAKDAAAGIDGRAAGFELDVSSKESYAAFVDGVLAEFGQIDVLVNNAGVMPLKGFLDEADAVSRITINVNVWGPIHGMRLVMPHMIEQGHGHIVNVASMAGKIPLAGMAVYNASKFAVVGLTGAVRDEYAGSGVSLTAILPSAVNTRLASGVDMPSALPRVEPSEVAKAIVDSVSNRRAEISVPGYLAPLWGLADAAVPNPVLRGVLRAGGARSALTRIRPDRDEYERTIREQSNAGD